ncbi:MAG TPA: hypothetical protein VGQ46_04410, partial [Thermoanaerobaculia bacterium]|nr:hypothetical protein [Thermoanaerobaculia bacterium]
MFDRIFDAMRHRARTRKSAASSQDMRDHTPRLGIANVDTVRAQMRREIGRQQTKQMHQRSRPERWRLAGFHEKALLVKGADVAAPRFLKLRRDPASIRTLNERIFALG